MLLNASSCARRTVRPNKPKRRSLEQRKVYCRACQETGVLCSENPKLPEGFPQSIFKDKGREGCGRLWHLSAGILCSCICPGRSGHHVPVNLQQDTCYSLFCNLLSLYEPKSVLLVKVRAARICHRVCFRPQATFFYKTCRASISEPRQQSTKVKGTGNWFSLLRRHRQVRQLPRMYCSHITELGTR